MKYARRKTYRQCDTFRVAINEGQRSNKNDIDCRREAFEAEGHQRDASGHQVAQIASEDTEILNYHFIPLLFTGKRSCMRIEEQYLMNKHNKWMKMITEKNVAYWCH